MNEEEYFEQLCSNSVDGTLTDSEKQKLEDHLAECPSCAALKQDLEQMRSLMAVEAEPPEGLHESIMERLRQEEPVRVVKPQKPMRRLPVFTMVAAAAVVVLVVLGGGLMPAFSTVNGGGSSGAAETASAENADSAADSGMQESVQQAAAENSAAVGGADTGAPAAAKSGSSSADSADYGVQSYAAADDGAEEPGEVDPAEQQAASGGRAVPDEAVGTAESDTQAAAVTAQSVFSLPQSLYGLRAAYCYVAIGGSNLPDIGGELLAQENGVSWFKLDSSMDTLQKTLQIAEKAGYTVSAYDDIGLTIDSRASSWILAVAAE